MERIESLVRKESYVLGRGGEKSKKDFDYSIFDLMRMIRKKKKATTYEGTCLDMKMGRKGSVQKRRHKFKESKSRF